MPICNGAVEEMGVLAFNARTAESTSCKQQQQQQQWWLGWKRYNFPSHFGQFFLSSSHGVTSIADRSIHHEEGNCMPNGELAGWGQKH